MLGSDTIGMPSAVEAEAAVPKVEVSEDCTASEEVEAGIAIFAVISTLPASTVMVTSAMLTPAAAANLACRKVVLA